MNQNLRRNFERSLPPRYVLSLTACLVATLHAANAGDVLEQPGTNKNRYHLLAPTPRSELRDLSTDRPDKTESAYTVDAGPDDRIRFSTR
jgi:hypothetical protein